jgi:hypothetical protein
MLNEVSAEELQLVIGVPDKIAKTIASFTKAKKLETWIAYEEVLSPEEMGFLENKIRSLNDVQVKYLMNPVETRYDVVRSLKEYVVDLDKDNKFGISGSSGEDIGKLKI